MRLLDMDEREIKIGDIVIRAHTDAATRYPELRRAIVTKFFDDGRIQIKTQGTSKCGVTEPDRVLSITAVHRYARGEVW